MDCTDIALHDVWSGVHIFCSSFEHSCADLFCLNKKYCWCVCFLQCRSATVVITCRFTVKRHSSCQPHFTALASLWAGLEGEMLLLSMLTNVASGLRAFLSAQSLLSPDQLELLLLGLQVRTDADRCSETAGETHNQTEITVDFQGQIH